MSFPRALLSIASLVILLAVPASVAAGRGRAPAIVAWRPRAWRPAAGAADVGIAIDPVDGVIAVAAAPKVARVPRLPEFLRPDGSRRLQLDERFEEFAVVTLGADGRARFGCVRGPRAAARAVLDVPCGSEAPAPVVDR